MTAIYSVNGIETTSQAVPRRRSQSLLSPVVSNRRKMREREKRAMAVSLSVETRLSRLYIEPNTFVYRIKLSSPAPAFDLVRSRAPMASAVPADFTRSGTTQGFYFYDPPSTIATLLRALSRLFSSRDLSVVSVGASTFIKARVCDAAACQIYRLIF